MGGCASDVERGTVPAWEESMFFNVGLVLMGAWLLGVVGVYTLDRVHVLLLGSLMFFVFAFVERRPVATRPHKSPREGNPVG